MGEKMNKKGFTIIEVALVLAIGGLIFLMVFVALPGLRASQRDAERRENVNTFLNSVKKYQSNNRGTLPGSVESANIISVTNGSAGAEATWAGFYRDYLGENFMDPDGENYRLEVVNCGKNLNADEECEGYGNNLSDLTNALFPNNYKMIVVLQATCFGEKTIKSSNPRKLAVLYKLEGAGVYCSNT